MIIALLLKNDCCSQPNNTYRTIWTSLIIDLELDPKLTCTQNNDFLSFIHEYQGKEWHNSPYSNPSPFQKMLAHGKYVTCTILDKKDLVRYVLIIE